MLTEQKNVRKKLNVVTPNELDRLVSLGRQNRTALRMREVREQTINAILVAHTELINKR